MAHIAISAAVATYVDDNNVRVRFDDDRIRFGVIEILACRDVRRVHLLRAMSELLFMEVDIMVPVDLTYEEFVCVRLPREP